MRAFVAKKKYKPTKQDANLNFLIMQILESAFVMIPFCCCVDFCLFVEPGNLMVVFLKNTLSYNGIKTDDT